MIQSTSIRQLLTLLLCTLGMVVFGQQSMTLTNLSPPVGPLMPQSLTMVLITNTGAEALSGHVEAELLDASLDPIATLRSVNLTLQSGQQASYTSIPWTNQVTYGTTPQANRLRTSGQLQEGDFLLCHTFVDAAGIEVARSCIEKRAELNINFSLIYPANGSVLEQPRPTLIWENVAQFGLNAEGITYELKVVELNRGQSEAEALERNVPLLHQRNLRVTSLLYPEGVRPLELERTYAWMVRVHQDQNEVLISQPWRFSLSEQEEAPPELDLPSYVMPAHSIDSRTYQFGGAIYLGFDNNEGIKELDYSVIPLSDQGDAVTGLPTVADLRSGLNTIDIPTASMNLREGEVYRLTIHTPQKRSYFLQFRYSAK